MENYHKQKRSRPRHLPTRLRETKRANDAVKYKEGFDDGYRLGIEEGRRQAVKVSSQ